MLVTCTVAGFFVFSCASPAIVPDAGRYCQIAKLVRYSSRDTAETRQQLRDHNAAWRKACERR